MKIFKSVPNDSTQWRSDSPSVKAMRLILPVAAILSAVSLGGGLSSFLELDLLKTIHLIIAAGFVIGAFFFDAMGITSGRSVVRDFILSANGETERGVLFWINVSLAAVICSAVVFGSFRASKNGIKYLVVEYRKAQEVKTETDTTLTATVDEAEDKNAAILEAKRQAYEAQRAAMASAWDGKIKAVTVEIGRRKKQRTKQNYQYIDNLVAKLEKQRAELEGKKGEALAGLAAGFAEEQARLLASAETLTAVTVEDAKEASERRKEKQAEKDAADAQLSALVAGIFSWSIVLMLVIGLRLELLEVRNGILPNPILSNGDLSGLEDVRRFVMAVPYFLFSWIHYGAEMLYTWAAKRRPPVVDNDLIDYRAAQIEVAAIRKEGKVRTLPTTEPRRAIGYNSTGGTTGKGHAPFNLHEKPHETGPEDPTKSPTDETTKPENAAKARQLRKDLNKYKKRHARHVQKKIALESKGEPVPQRTLEAIENNEQWVKHFEAKLKALH